MSNRSHLKPLIILFFIFAFVKIIFSVFLRGPAIFPDESCFALKAMDLVDNFSFRSCAEVSGYESGGEFPLTIFLISPIYLFLRGKASYFAVLILQSILSASLIFPFFGIIKQFITKNKIAILISSIMLFIPQIFVYEKSTMSEFFYIFFNVWFLYFYSKSFNKNGKKFKILSYVFSIIAALARPFGFLLPLALIANELIVYKKKKLFLVLVLMLGLNFALMCFFMETEKVFSILNDKFVSLLVLSNYPLILQAIVNQINSFSISLFLVPVLIFFVFFKKRDSKIWTNLKYFFLVFFILNFLISSQHIYGYFLENKELGFLTRYINMSLVYFVLLSFIFLFRYKKVKIGWKTILLYFVLILSFFFLEKNGKRVQNVEISAFYSVFPTEESRTGFMYYLKYPLMMSFVGMAYLFFKNKFVWLRNILVVFLILVSIFSYKTMYFVPNDTSLSDYVIDNPRSSITYILTFQKKDLIHFWKFMAYSYYDIKTVVNVDEDVLVVNYENIDSDLIITFFDLPGYEAMGFTEKYGKVYKVYKQK